MQVMTLLQQKGSFVATINPNATLRHAVTELSRHNIGALVVTRDGHSIDGMISERDIVRALSRDGAAVLDETVGTLMSTEIHTCAPEDDVNSLVTTMTNERVRHIPVTTATELVGIISIGDVVKTRMEELEQDRDALVSYINAR